MRTLDATPCCPNCGADNYSTGGTTATFSGVSSHKKCFACEFQWREWNYRSAMLLPAFKEHRS